MSIERDYILNYIVNAAAAVSSLRQVKTELALVDGETKKATADVALFTAELQRAALHTQQLSANCTTTTGSVGALGKEAHGLLPAWQVFEIGVTLAQNFGEYVNQAREHVRELGREAAETRDKMRELANLKGEPGPNDALVAEAVVMGMNAGLVPDDARKFLEQFEGSIPAGRDKGNIKPDLEQPLAQEAMRFGVRMKLDPKTAGDLAGVLPQYGKITSVEQGMGKMGAVLDALNAGRGNAEPLTRSLIKTAGSIVEEQGGPVGSLEELAAMLGVASTNATPDRAGTHLRQMVRGLRHFDDDAQGRTLKDLGITPEMKTRDALAKIAPKIREADAAKIGGDVWLRQHGFKREEEIESILQMSRNETVVQKRVDKATAANAGAKVIQADEEFLTKEKTGIHRRNAAEDAAQKWLTGAREEMREEARVTGQGILRDEHKVGGVGNAVRHAALNGLGILPAIGVKKNEQAEAEEAFMGNLYDEARRVGVDAPTLHNELNPGHKAAFITKPAAAQGTISKTLGTYDANNRALFARQFDTPSTEKIVAAVIRAGGDPFRGSKPATAAKLAARKDDDRAGQAEEVVGRITEQGAKVGVDVPAAATRILGHAPKPRDFTDAPGARALQQLAGQVKGAGADPFGGSRVLEQKFDKLIEEAKRTNDILKNPAPGALGPGAGPVAPGRK